MISKIREELGELEKAIDGKDVNEIEDELGDLFFSVVNLARYRNIDPEVLMAAANKKFEIRFGAMEKELKSQANSLEQATLDEMQGAWLVVKARGL